VNFVLYFMVWRFLYVFYCIAWYLFFVSIVCTVWYIQYGVYCIVWYGLLVFIVFCVLYFVLYCIVSIVWYGIVWYIITLYFVLHYVIYVSSCILCVFFNVLYSMVLILL